LLDPEKHAVYIERLFVVLACRIVEGVPLTSSGAVTYLFGEGFFEGWDWTLLSTLCVLLLIGFEEAVPRSPPAKGYKSSRLFQPFIHL
jgi:hypothetical protein